MLYSPRVKRHHGSYPANGRIVPGPGPRMNGVTLMNRTLHRGRPPMIRTVALAVSAALGLAMMLGLAAAGAGPAAAASTTSNSTLRIESQTSFSTFNPFTAYFDGDLEVINQIYPFLTASNEQGQPVPYLATKWNLSADKLSWTFTIRSA